MKRTTVVLGMLLLSGIASAMLAADEQPPKYQVPDDPQAVVVSLDYRGGFTPPRLKNDPTMSILADGTVLIPANYQGQKAFEGKLTEAQLQKLLGYLVGTCQLIPWDADAVRKKMARGGPRPIIADAATAHLYLHVNGKEENIASPIVGISAGPNEVAELRRLNDARARLEQVRSIVQLGGEENLKGWLQKANKQLLAQHPQAAPLTSDDLQSGAERVDGSYYISFNRRVEGKPGNPPVITNVFINQPANGEPKVSVTHREVPGG